LDILPYFKEVDPQPDFHWQSKDKLILSPGEQEVDVKFEEDEVSGATEYGWGIWSRWFMEFPKKLLRKDP